MSSPPNEHEVGQIKLPQVIDERVDQTRLFGSTRPQMQIDCSELRRINSVGIRNLIIALNRLKIDGAKITLVGVTAPMMEAIDFVSNLLPEGSTIESVYLPYCCMQCQHQFQELHEYAGLTSRQEQLMTSTCPKCGKEAEFDNLPEIFFKDR